ncbi:MAG: hypothetical protein FJW99_03510 [Actinobacteria bacterium]|nr:hypothetical protein [Actinomycetota bacterium]
MVVDSHFLVTFSRHFWMASFFLMAVWSRMMRASASSHGMSRAGLTFTVMMCQPNWVFTGCEISPSPNAKAAFSNSGTRAPSWMAPRLPPCDFDPGSVEYCLARSAKFEVLAMARMRSASSSVFTRMCEASRVACCLNSRGLAAQYFCACAAV